jgi:RNA-binding protein 5/10
MFLPIPMNAVVLTDGQSYEMMMNQVPFHGNREMPGPTVERYVDMNERDRERFRDRDRRRERDRDRDRKQPSRRDGRRDESLPPRDRDRERSRDRYATNDDDDANQYKDYDTREVFDYEHQRSSSERDSFSSQPQGPPVVPGYGLDLIGHGDSADQDHRDERSSRDNMPRGEDKGGEKWMTDSPTNTILLRGLPPSVDEKDIRAELMMFGAPIKEVRLMKRKDTGVSRGFAFVEFQTIGDAQRWMEHNQV